jgi:autotransporter-associated beta strand protein
LYRMKKAFLAVLVVAILSCPAVAAPKYWDINGTAANTGTTANGTWSAAATNWNDDSSGTGGNITGWAVTTDQAVFSSDTGFTGNTTITASGTPVATGGVIIEEGQITLSGRVDVNTGIIELKSGTTLVQASSGGATGTGFTITAGGGYLISGNATLRQTNTGNAGSFVATAATVALANNSTLTLDYTATASPAAPISIVQQGITGSGSIVKNGAGIIRMGVASTYSGSTTINAGELRFGGSAANRLPVTTDLIINGGILNMAASSQSQTVASLSGTGGSIGGGGATLTINKASGSTSYSGLLANTAFIPATTVAGTTGTLTIVKNGNSTQAFTGANTYSGNTTINGGVLAANNTTGSATGTSAITIAGGGTLAGTGAVTGAVTVNGKISPGDSNIQSLGVGALSFGSSSTFVAEIDSSASLSAAADLLQSTGSLTIAAGAQLMLTDIAGTSIALPLTTKLTLMSYALGTWNNVIFNGIGDDTEITIGANTFLFDYNDTTPGSSFGGEAVAGRSYVTLTAVPEPTAFVIGGLSCGLIGLGYIRRKYIARRAAVAA